MSRIGNKPITIPDGVKMEVKGTRLTTSGPKGVLNLSVHPRMELVLEENRMTVKRKSGSRLDKSLHGLTRSLIQGAVIGVSKGYEKVLELEGIGYKASVEKNGLSLSLGFTHPIVFAPLEGISFEVEVLPRSPERPALQCLIFVRGASKELVGEIASKIRACRKPEPYKGTGIRYRGEHVRRKAGKTGV